MPELISHALVAALRAMVPRSLTVCSYRTSLKAKRKAAVSTLCVTLGPMPVVDHVWLAITPVEEIHEYELGRGGWGEK